MPLESWICDTCEGPVGTNGILVYQSDADGKAFDFKIVHKASDSPRDRSCDPQYAGDPRYGASVDISSLVGTDGLAYLMTYLSAGPLIVDGDPSTDRVGVADMTAFVDLVRRVQTPYYEEARRRFADDDVINRFADSNEAYPYMQYALRDLVDES